MGIICKCEPSLNELLSDPMMELVFNYYRVTADDVRSLVRDAAVRLTRAKAGGRSQRPSKSWER